MTKVVFHSYSIVFESKKARVRRAVGCCPPPPRTNIQPSQRSSFSLFIKKIFSEAQDEKCKYLQLVPVNLFSLLLNKMSRKLNPAKYLQTKLTLCCCGSREILNKYQEMKKYFPSIWTPYCTYVREIFVLVIQFIITFKKKSGKSTIKRKECWKYYVQ